MNKDMLDVLVCPVGKYPLNLLNDTLVCSNCNAVFEIREDIPILLIEGAKLPEGMNDIFELKCMKS